MIGARGFPVTCLAVAGMLSASGSASGTEASARTRDCCAIVELRQYTLHPGRFDGFARMFESEFLEPLEAAGMTVIGQFRDLNDPNRFVWLRGFADMPSRASALAAFYDGPVWKARRDAANANFTDTDNVLLLHPVVPASGLRLPPLAAPAPAAVDDGGVIVATVYALASDAAPAFPAWFQDELQPVLAAAGVAVAATFATEASANNFPRLPVREGEHVFVWIARFPDRSHADAALDRLGNSARWRTLAAPLQQRFAAPPQLLRLAPTPRSRLRG